VADFTTRSVDTGDKASRGAALAAADADAFRSEGPRIDARIGTLASLVFAVLASTGAVGGVGTSISRARHAEVATWLLVAGAVAFAVGFVMIVRLILPRLVRVTPATGVLAWAAALPLVGPLVRRLTRIRPAPGALAQVAALPDTTAAAAYYAAAAEDCLAYQATDAWAHGVAIARRFRRFRRAGWVLTTAVVLAAAGFLALGWGW
jgi:hypothetical protein